MAAPVYIDPPAAVAPAEVGTTMQGKQVAVPVGGASEVAFADLQLRQEGDAGSLSPGSMRAKFHAAVTGAAEVPVSTGPATGRSAIDFGRFSEARQEVLTPSLMRWEQLLVDLGIKDADALVVFKPGSERGVLVTKGEFFDQGLNVDRTGLSYSIAGSPVADFSRWLLGARGEFSAVTLKTNGRDFLLTPSYTVHNLAPGMSMSLSSNVGRLMSVTDGLMPKFNHMLSGDLRDSAAGVDVAGGRLVMNSYRLLPLTDATVTRFDFQGDRLNSSLLIGTGLQGYNFVALRGMGEAYGANVQRDAMFAQHLGGGSGLAGTLSVFGELGRHGGAYRIGLEGYQLFNNESGASDQFIRPVLGQPGDGSPAGFHFFFELRR